MTKGKQDKVSHLLAAMHETCAPGHSPLYLWMRQNHDCIAEGLIGDAAPSSHQIVPCG